MSITTLPPLAPVGGHVTQKLLIAMPDLVSSSRNTLMNAKDVSNKKMTHPHCLSTSSKKSEVVDTARCRNSFFHNLCIDMLQEGYHLAFKELFNLVQQDKSVTSRLENGSARCTVLEDSEKKLEFLKVHLIAAEKAKRQGRAKNFCQSYMDLAKQFEGLSDFRLADHFYQLAFESSQLVRGDGRCKEAEACWYLGKAAERQKDFQRSLQYFEQFYALAKGKDWKTDDGVLFSLVSCHCLQSVYVTLALQEPLEEKEKVMKRLHKAYDVAKTGGDSKAFGEVAYIMGTKYDLYGDQDKAMQYYNDYLEICKANSDDLGIGKASQAIAHALQRKGDLLGAVDNLKTCLRVSEKAGNLKAKQEACSYLAALYDNMGKYEQSAKYHRRAFRIAKEWGQLDLVEEARCEYAVSLTHGLLTGFVEALTKYDRAKLDCLTLWKSERVQGFSRDKITYDMFRMLDQGTSSASVKREWKRSAIDDKESPLNRPCTKSDDGDVNSNVAVEK